MLDFDTIVHIEKNKNKDLVHIVKVSDVTFTKSYISRKSLNLPAQTLSLLVEPKITKLFLTMCFQHMTKIY